MSGMDRGSRKPRTRPGIAAGSRTTSSASGKLPSTLQRKAACTCGGTCPLCSEQQTRLPVSRPGDALERQADEVAARVVNHGGSGVRAGTAGPVAGMISRKPHSSAGTSLPTARIGPASNGRPLDATTRAFMEPRFGHDFGNVRVHTDDQAAESANALGARAYTVGHDITFSRGEFDTSSRQGNTLLAHELTHVVQQRDGALQLQRDVTPRYATIEDRLTYKFLDWAITDENARDVLNLLNTLSDVDLADTVAAMDRDGLLDRLMDNVSKDDQEVFAVLIGRINRHRSVAHTGDWVIEQLSRGFFDWAITNDDAKRAFMVLRGLESQELRSVVAKMVNAGVYDRLREELPDEEVARFAAFMARLDRIRDEFNALVGEQVDFFRNQKDEEGNPVSAGEVISKKVEKTGYGGSESTWGDLSSDDKKAWRKRARDAIEKVKASVKGTQLDEVLSRGKLVFIPEEAEKLNAYAYVSGANKLYFGRSWVKDAEKDPQNVWQSIAHELGGHEEFGDTWSWEIMKAALARLTPEERRKASSGKNSIYSAYGYLETELYAELRELPHRVAGSSGDKPQNDVPAQLKKIKEAFGEKVALQVVVRLYYRVALDPRISQEAKTLFYRAVQDVFKLFPLVDDYAP
jgi:hypothetical protein